MVSGEGGSTGRQCFSEIGPREGDPIEIALTKNDATRASNRFKRVGIAVKSVPFLKDRALGCVQVFRFLVRLEGSTSETDDATPYVLDREGESTAQSIVVAGAGFSLGEESCLHTQIAGDALLPETFRDRIPARRSESDPEAFCRSPVETSRSEIAACDLAFGLSKRFAVELLGHVVGFIDPGTETGLRRTAFFGDLDPEVAGKRARRFGKREPVVLHQEGDDVAALLATETMKDLSIGIDVERRGLFIVEGA